MVGQGEVSLDSQPRDFGAGAKARGVQSCGHRYLPEVQSSSSWDQSDLLRHQQKLFLYSSDVKLNAQPRQSLNI